MDTLFIKNKGIFFTRCNNNNKNIGRNKYYKNKRGIKVSTIVDSNGVPLNLECFMGNSNDAKFVDRLYNNSFVDYFLINKKYKKKSYFLGDKAYDTKNIRNLTKNNHITIIDYNKRNSKKVTKKLNTFEKKIYKKRIKVENFYSWLTRFPKMNIIVERSLESFTGLVLLCTSLILENKIKQNK